MAFAVYKSSAGSGKTFTLVKEYLKLVLPEPASFKNILAITFTNKAANEMKERVLTTLEDLSKPLELRCEKTQKVLLPKLIEELGMSEQEIQVNAATALKLILHRYSDFSIGTIDGFSHRLVRSFAHDFGLPVNFNVELNADELLESAVDLLLDKVGDDAELTKMLVRFLETRMDEDQGYYIEKILLDFARILVDEEGLGRLNRIDHLGLNEFDEIVTEIFKQINQFEQKIKELGQKGVDLIDYHSIPIAAFYQGDRGIGGYFTKLAAGRFDLIQSDNYTRKTVDEDKWSSSKADSISLHGIDTIKPELTHLFNEILLERELHFPFYIFLKLLAKTIYPLAVLKEIHRTLVAFKKQNNIVHISEFNRKIAEIVVDEPVPFIYERLGERYNHILIDEFQDTSRLQWCNLQPLIENSLAVGHFNLVVGDGKQAIYRWRNGDVYQFTQLPKLPGSDQSKTLAARERILTTNYKPSNLNENFRSKAEIVTFNNRLFSCIARTYEDQIGLVYGDLIQQFDPERTGGFIQIKLIEPTEELDYRTVTCNELLATIRQLTTEDFTYGDIAVLCRTNRDGSEVARFLLDQGVPVISSESLLIQSSPKVKFLTAILHFLHDPTNAISASEILTFLFLQEKLKSPTLHEVLAPLREKFFDTYVWKLLQDSGFSLTPQALTFMTTYDLCEEVLRTFDLNSQPDPYVQFFLDQVLKFSSKHSSHQSDFIEWWNDQQTKQSVIIPEGLDAIRVLTIHKAKGLQFPVVLYPFADERKKNGRNYLWVDLEEDQLKGLTSALLRSSKEMEETIYADLYKEEGNQSLLDLVNTFYVATTRPEERLYLFCKPVSSTSVKSVSIPLFIKQFLEEEGLLREGETTYQFGQKGKREVKVQGKLKETPIPLRDLRSSRWVDQLTIRLRAPEVWDVENPEGKVKFGKLIHFILSKAKTRADLPNVLHELEHSGYIHHSEVNAIHEKCVEILTHPDVARFFDETVTSKTEIEILKPNGGTIRPDRVVFIENEAIVIDFKTGKPNSKHEAQIRAYGDAIREMGFSNMRLLLLYSEPEVHLVSVEM